VSENPEAMEALVSQPKPEQKKEPEEKGDYDI
jgi:hypothetical protein